MQFPTSFTAKDVGEDEVDHTGEACTLPTPLQGQEKSNWCWAAVSSMVSNTDAPGEGTPQSELVDDVLRASSCVRAKPPTDLSNCCQALSKASMPNGQARLGCALEYLRRKGPAGKGTVPYETITTEIAGGRPVGIHVNSGGAGHFVIVTGHDDDEHVHILDPWPVASIRDLNGGTVTTLPYSDLVKGYHSPFLKGAWDYTYRTQSAYAS